MEIALKSLLRLMRIHTSLTKRVQYACNVKSDRIFVKAAAIPGTTALKLVEEKNPQLKTFFDKNTNALRGIALLLLDVNSPVLTVY